MVLDASRNSQQPAADAAPTAELFGELDPEPRLLMGPGPVDVYPRVLRAMSVPLQGQFDPQFTGLHEPGRWRSTGRCSAPANHWTFLIDGTARAGIEACLASTLAPGDKLLVPIFGRFGHLKVEIGRRLGADVAVDRDGVGPRVRDRRHRGRDQAASAAHARHQPRRHLHHHAAAAGRDRRPVPPARRAALRRLHGLARRQPVRDGRLADRRGLGRPAEMPVGSAGLLAHHLQRPGRRGGQRPQACRAGPQGAGHASRATAPSSAPTTSTSPC